ncbi:carbohydrate ABC transporter permease [Paenibacillus alkalitolerans]|uniref:carbohydrate ABC transporter permease n=1 Tax=Paenibacillus alkalitolerans TaxID=2799335 RepID=UPI0018F58BE5|nr:sugar ABC transporter permease [Paenibacillus alkalitolerans]
MIGKLKKKRDHANLSGYLFISPFLVGFFWLTIFPIGMSLYLSFTKFDLLGSPRWIGLDNYVRMFTEDDKFWQSLKVTFLYAFTAVPFRLVFALAVALLLVKTIRGSGFYRTALYLPSIIGGSVAVAVMWRQLFGNNGAINGILEALGLPTTSWLGNPDTAIWTLILLFGWQFGSSMLIFLAGLKNIPMSYYEAASVDGANAWYRFSRITIPLLTPIILFNVIMQMISGFLSFTPSFIITQGGPLNSTLLYALYLYQRGFMFFEMGYASAMAWVLLLIIGIFTAFVFRSSKHWVHYESGGDR